MPWLFQSHRNLHFFKMSCVHMYVHFVHDSLLTRVVANRKAFFGEQAVLVLVVLVWFQGFYNRNFLNSKLSTSNILWFKILWIIITLTYSVKCPSFLRQRTFFDRILQKNSKTQLTNKDTLNITQSIGWFRSAKNAICRKIQKFLGRFWLSMWVKLIIFFFNV